MSDAPLLCIRDLGVTFGAATVVDHVSLDLHRGEILALVGESGSGKSLTALSVMQLLPPEARMTGTVHMDGVALTSKPEAELRQWRGKRIGMVFQEPLSALNPLHTIDRQILEPLLLHERLSREESRTRLAALYDAVGLTHLKDRGKLYPHQLSGGERQRVMIAIALSCNPDLIIADEPTTALDVTLQVQILALLKKLQRERNIGILLITHDLTIVRTLADRVCVMRRGVVVESATAAELFNNPKHDYTRMLIHALPKGAPQPIAPDAPVLLEASLSVDFPIKTGLFQSRRFVRAVDQVSLRLHAGETLGIVGESGSGKSSLAYAILRLIKSNGPIVFLSQRMDTLRASQIRPLRKQLQIVFQDPYGSLNPRLTVGELIAEGLKVHAPPATHHAPHFFNQEVEKILRQVGLEPAMANRYPHEFSGGQRQRIAIARAMILKPALVVLDEPTSALDMSVQAQVLDLLQQMQREAGVAYLFISHDLRTVRAMAHRVLVMKHGKMVEEGPCATILSHPSQPYTRALIDAAFAQTL